MWQAGILTAAHDRWGGASPCAADIGGKNSQVCDFYGKKAYSNRKLGKIAADVLLSSKVGVFCVRVKLMAAAAGGSNGQNKHKKNMVVAACCSSGSASR